MKLEKEPEKEREYKATFQFVAGPEIPPSSAQHIEIHPCEDFALMALGIATAETAMIEDFRTILYNCGLEVENEKGKLEVQTRLLHLPSGHLPIPSGGIPLAQFWAAETVQLRILYDPRRATAKRVSAPVEITIRLLGFDRHKAKKKATKKTARKKRATQ